MSFLQESFADRIGGINYGKSTEIYKFEKIKRAKRAALLAHPDSALIDMGVGEPDEMAFPEVVAALCAAAKDPANRGYADNGGAEFKRSAAAYMDHGIGKEKSPAFGKKHHSRKSADKGNSYWNGKRTYS